jgi:hypothetical protein
MDAFDCGVHDALAHVDRVRGSLQSNQAQMADPANFGMGNAFSNSIIQFTPIVGTFPMGLCESHLFIFESMVTAKSTALIYNNAP